MSSRHSTRAVARAARRAAPIPKSLRRAWRARWTAFLMIVLAGAILAAPTVYRWHTDRLLAADAARAAATPTDAQKAMLDRARAWNTDLASNGQRVLGDAWDPWSPTGDKTPIAVKDTDYQSMLDTDGDGLMGSIRIPKIGVDLPIYHGTTQDILAKGSGHMYGTSLPVGGADTRAVITAHRGLPKAALFTRLDEMEKGDPFYLHVAGETLGYRVARIEVIRPDEYKRLLIEPGRDEVTLLTCTPYGVNTHRLLVTGVRARIGVDIPAEDGDAAGPSRPDWRPWAIGGGVAAAGGGAVLVAMGCARDARVWRRRRARAAGGGDDGVDWERLRETVG
ncbi:class C sortase [Bifidobacterium myosotis]|uniref:Class C sortase n=1 Tax=Bifidobacterium myosotis TaxID=1630166 RepID=A0A5M9ZHN5_9BIFI|nr:class C sortase [Bifidobacterium myosotis]KAA8826969.1 class C sortase [Bifidobacterium myosotis]